MARRDRTDMTPGAALGVILAVLIGVAGAMLFVHWMACSQADGAALCSIITATALPVRGPWWRRVARRLAIWRCRQDTAYLQYAIAQWQRMLVSDSIAIEDLRDRLATQQRRMLDLRSRP